MLRGGRWVVVISLLLDASLEGVVWFVVCLLEGFCGLVVSRRLGEMV